MIQLTPKVTQHISNTYKYWVETNQKQLLDLALGYSSHTWGYKNERLINAFTRGINNDVSFICQGQTCNTLEQVNKKLLEKTNMKALLWAISGSDAIEAAIQIALQYQELTYRKYNFLSFCPSYHGCTWLARILNGERKHPNFTNISIPTWTKMEEQEVIEQHVWKDLEYHLSKDSQIGGIVLESMPWFNGHRPWSTFWWEKMSMLQKKNILLIIDDIACGFGKVAPYTSHQRLNISPDIVAVGKALTGGYAPISAALVGSNIFPIIQKDSWWHGHTWHPYIPALHLINECLDMTDCSKFDQLEKQLDIVLASVNNISHFRGIGLMKEVFLTKRVTPETMLNAGIIANKKAENSFTVIAPQIADDVYWEELKSRLNRL